MKKEKSVTVSEYFNTAGLGLMAGTIRKKALRIIKDGRAILLKKPKLRAYKQGLGLRKSGRSMSIEVRRDGLVAIGGDLCRTRLNSKMRQQLSQ